MEQKTKKINGGPRPGAGAPKKEDKKVYKSIGFRPAQLEAILKKYKSIQKWVDETLKEQGY